MTDQPQEQVRVNIEPRINVASISYERKFNLGDYESLTISVSLWADVNPEEEIADDVIRALINKARSHVKEQATPAIVKSSRYQLSQQHKVAGVPVNGNGNGAR